MDPNPLEKSIRFSSAEPLQIISQPYVQPNEKYQTKTHHRQQKHFQWKKVAKLLLNSLVPGSIRSILPEDYSQIVWRNVMTFIYLHIAGIYGLYLFFTAAKAKTILWGLFIAECSTLGVTCGAHRLWTHKSYKAKLPFRIILAFWQTVALQNSIFEWSRDHRVHHKFVDTNADPHNSEKGFFFSHMGWLMTKKHKDVIIKGKTIDVSDLKEDPVVMFQKQYYMILAPLLCFVFPAMVPWYFWNESWTVCWNTSILRYMAVLHGTWCINSVCHMFGTKPFDKNISAVENLTMGILSCGEGWHNFHHVFPWDYKAAELGNYRANFSIAIIDFMAKIGWAYDLKTVSVETIAKRAARTGDGSRKYDNILNKLYEDHHLRDSADNIWGWDDKDMTVEEKKITDISHIKCDS